MPPESKAEHEKMKAAMAEAQKKVPPAPPAAHGLAEGTPVDLKIYVRGNPAKQGDLAPRRFLRIVAGRRAAKFTKGSGRLELAEAIADPKNPLTARVMVNRVWQQHFGRGLVGTPSNFGALGDRPTHPELLDALADRFVENGWSVKKLHREIVLSETYRLAQHARRGRRRDRRRQPAPVAGRRGGGSSRGVPRRAAGRIGRSGPDVRRADVDLNDANNRRRTVYAKVSRHDLYGLLRLFDFPDANITERQADRRRPCRNSSCSC